MSSLPHGPDSVDSSESPVRKAGRPSNSHPQLINAQTLFGARQELHIEHAGCLYRLRITRNGKLILTK